MKVFIYKITSVNNKSYIGQVIEKKGINTRWKQHVNCAKLNKEKGSRFLNSAILKYGEDNFDHDDVRDDVREYAKYVLGKNESVDMVLFVQP